MLSTFLLSLKAEYSALSYLVTNTCFSPICLCESTFSTLTSIKTKYLASNKGVKTAMRQPLTNVEPRFDLLCKNMQNRKSH